jgi:hypothetical protein
MEQQLTFHLAITGCSKPIRLHQEALLGRPSDRIYRGPTTRREQVRLSSAPRTDQPVVQERTIIRLQPIVSRPLQPYALRESACQFLECRSSGRRCIVAGAREVDLGYQVSYCLGDRHAACPMYQASSGHGRAHRVRRVVYAAVVLLMLGLVVAAVVQALGSSAPVELGRAVGLG